MEFVSTGDTLLSSVHGLAALGALRGLNGCERHLGLCKLRMQWVQGSCYLIS